jgi:hypothetical protein
LIEHNAVDWRARLWVFKTEWNFCGGGWGLYGWFVGFIENPVVLEREAGEIGRVVMRRN